MSAKEFEEQLRDLFEKKSDNRDAYLIDLIIPIVYEFVKDEVARIIQQAIFELNRRPN